MPKEEVRVLEMRPDRIEKELLLDLIVHLADTMTGGKRVGFDESIKNKDFARGVLIGMASVMDTKVVPEIIKDRNLNNRLGFSIKNITEIHGSGEAVLVEANLKPGEKCPGCGKVHEKPAVH